VILPVADHHHRSELRAVGITGDASFPPIADDDGCTTSSNVQMPLANSELAVCSQHWLPWRPRSAEVKHEPARPLSGLRGGLEEFANGIRPTDEVVQQVAYPARKPPSAHSTCPTM